MTRRRDIAAFAPVVSGVARKTVSISAAASEARLWADRCSCDVVCARDESRTMARPLTPPTISAPSSVTRAVRFQEVLTEHYLSTPRV